MISQYFLAGDFANGELPYFFQVIESGPGPLEFNVVVFF